MNNFPSHNLESLQNGQKEGNNNNLWHYLQSLDPDLVTQLSQPSQEVAQVMERNLMGLLGGLPPENFGVSITTSRENLGRLLVSAMVNGYFLHSAEQRMAFEKQLGMLDASEEAETEL